MTRKLLTILGAVVLVAFMTAQASAEQITIRGSLQRTVEAGGWLIVSADQKYLILNAQRFEKEPWFASSSEVEALGEKKQVVTIFMEGTPFEIQTLRPLSQGTAIAQSDSRLTKVMVTGDSIVQAQPDTAILNLSVVSQAKRAIDAQQDNAAKSDTVIRALKSAVGPDAEIKTSGYSLQPMRVYKEGQPPVITGYEARNSVTVVLSDLTKVGSVIDAAAMAGANDVGGISFTLRKDRPAKDQALAEATREALSKAQVIARALNGRVVRIVEVIEEGVQRPRPVFEDTMQMRTMAAANTPIEVGSLDITARVQLMAEIEAAPR